MGWSVVSEELGEFIEILPPQKRVGEHWYLGTADAVYQNLYSIGPRDREPIIVLSGDHVYKMDYAKMLRFHQEKNADATIATIEVPVADAPRYGIVSVDEGERVIGFQEKPESADAGAGVAGHGTGLDGHLRLPRGGARARARGGCGAPRQPARLRQEHHRR